MEKLKDQYISLSNKEMVKVVGVHNAAWWIGEKFGEVNYAAEQAGNYVHIDTGSTGVCKIS